MIITATKAEAVLPPRKHPSFRFGCGILAMLLLPVSYADDVQSRLKQHIQTEIQRFVNDAPHPPEKVQITLRMAAGIKEQSCHRLQFSRANANSLPVGRVGYRIECTAPARWQGRAVANIAVWMPVVVAGRTLLRDETLSADMLNTASRDLGSLSQAPVLSADNVLGMTVKRRIQQGDVLTLAVLSAPDVIKRGDQVTLIIRNMGFEASTRAVALEDSKVGQRLKVENLTSGQTVDGIALENGLVETQIKKH